MEDEAEASELGTRAYWEAAYDTELANLESTGDEGEVWFGTDTMETMLDWTCNLVRAGRGETWQDTKVLDIGTGNGAMLVALHARGFNHITGTDYSAASLRLAEAVLQRNGCREVCLRQDDITQTSLSETYDLLLDKGTYDAVGLSECAGEAQRAYRASAARLLQPGGLLVITSCNNTVAEMQQAFMHDQHAGGDDAQLAFTYVDHVRTYPTFKFAGMEGTHHCTIAFCAK